MKELSSCDAPQLNSKSERQYMRTRRDLFGKLIRRPIVKMLDRPGGRYFLSKMATYSSKCRTSADTEVFYDGLWTHRVGGYYFPDGKDFVAYPHVFRKWPKQAEKYISNAEEMWFQHYQPREGDIVIDIGAGHGEDTLAFSKTVGKTGRVIAVEAHPVSYEILNRFCRLNKLSNTKPLQFALMDKPGTVIMDEADIWEGNAVDQTRTTKGVTIPAKTLDDICRAEKIHDIDFLKMNIEGAECSALLGMSSMIHHIRTLCVACHDFRADMGHGEQFRTRTFVEKFLVENGFKVVSRPEDPRSYVRDHLFGIRPKD